MTIRKQRLTVTVDPELVEAGQRAVDAGDAASVSAWVNAALEDRARRDQALVHLASAVADYEREFGEITVEDMESRRRADRADAVVVRAARRSSRADRSA